jgi:AcrR family transcriptional regulator
MVMTSPRNKLRRPSYAKAPPEKAILDAAEYLFAEHGVDATSVRAIGSEARLNPALVHYYFASKDELLRRVIERRAGEINQVRRQGILTLFAESAPSLPTLEEVLDAFVRPTIEFGRDELRGGRSYTRLIDWMTAAIDPRSIKLVADNFDPIARYVILCLRRIVPELSQPDAVDCYLSAVRIAFLLMSPTGRAQTLAEGATSDVNAERAIAFAVRFVAAGIREIAGVSKA